VSGVYAIVVKDNLKYIGEYLNVSLWDNICLRDHITDLDMIVGKELTWFYFNDHQFKGIGSIMQHHTSTMNSKNREGKMRNKRRGLGICVTLSIMVFALICVYKIKTIYISRVSR
jgi:hypothetical protein